MQLLQLLPHCVLVSGTHAPLQSAFPEVHELTTQWPAVHVTVLAPAIFVQSFPHVPQFSGLLAVSTHSPDGSVELTHDAFPQQTVPLQVFAQVPAEQNRKPAATQLFWQLPHDVFDVSNDSQPSPAS